MHASYVFLCIVIHPDKTQHARAPEAFDLLKKVLSALVVPAKRSPTITQAESELSDPKKREELDAIIREARTQLLKSLSLPTNIPDDDQRLKGLVPSYKVQLRQASKTTLIEEEVRRRK